MGLASASDVTMQQSSAVYLQASTAEVKDSSVAVLVARQVSGGPIRAGILLAGRVEGPVETQVDTARALLAGITAGVFTGLILLAARLFTQRNR